MWNTLVGYENEYKINEYGNIFSLKRISNNSGSKSGKISIGGKIIKSFKNKYGYLNVYLYKNGFRKRFLLHNLVAISFLDNPKNRKEINHIDGNKENNHFSNLEWSTRSLNMRHCALLKNNKSSIYNNVYYRKDRKKWCSYFSINKKRFTVGNYNTELQAYNNLIKNEKYIQSTL